MRTILALVFLVGCVGSSSSDVVAGVEGDSDGDGCPAGQQAVFSGHGAELVCDDVPVWPPAATGSRAVAAECELADGTYRNLTWSTAVDSKVRPAFTWLKELTIAGAHYVEVDIGYTSTSAPPIRTTYTYNLDWLDAGRANVWESGDSDTWEFVVWRDCGDGLLHGVRTVNLPYPNVGGPQIQSWSFTGSPD